MPAVTVCVITRNQPHMVMEAVRSVYAQTFRDFELVIVDDASDDGKTPGVVLALALEAPDDIPARFVLREDIGGGPGPSRNTGFAGSTSEFLLPLDGDDMLNPEFLEATVGAIGDADVCFTDYRYIGDMDGVIRTGPWGPELLEKNRITVCSLIRRTAFERVGGYDESIPFIEDYDLWRMLYADGCAAVHVPRPLFLYRRHPEQWTAHQRGRPEAEARLRKKWETPLAYTRGDKE